MEDYQIAFIDLAREMNALKFGEFTLKSGRVSPYFFNAGEFCSGAALAERLATRQLEDVAVSELAAAAGSERLPLADFVRGNRQTARRSDQLLTAIWLPRPP